MPPAEVEPGLRRARAQAQLLRPATGAGLRGRPSAATAVRRLLAVQAQDPSAARLALRARLDGLTHAELAGAPLVVSWLCRGTLHLVTAEDWGWLLALTGPGRRAANRRRLAEEGVDEAAMGRAAEAIERALHEDGPLDRAGLAPRVAAAGVRTEGQAIAHVLMRCALDGRIVGRLDGRWRAAEPPALDADRDELLARLARRYLAAHAPAEPEDLAHWAGIGLAAARRGFAAAGAALASACVVPLPAVLPPRLLGPFDPYLLGWRDRSFAVPDAVARRVHPGGGMLRATVVDDGVAVGTWTRPGGRVAIDWFGDPVDVADEVADVERLLAE